MLIARAGLSPVMVGRGGELERLRRLFAAVADPQVALVSGEAGVGKTRLLRELVLGLPDGTAVLAGQAEEGAMGRPYQLLLEAAEPYLGGWSAVPEPLGARRDALRVLLAPVLPDLTPSDERDLAREELLRAAVDLVRHLVGGQDRAVVMFEDLQWADAESLALFGRLATTAGLPVLLIGSYRPGRAGPSSGRAAGVRAGVRNPRRPQAVAAGLVARARRGAGRLAWRAGRGGERARGAGPDRRTRAAGPPLLAGRAPGPLPPRPLMAVAPGRGPARGGGRVRAGARRLRGRAGRPGPAPARAARGRRAARAGPLPPRPWRCRDRQEPRAGRGRPAGPLARLAQGRGGDAAAAPRRRPGGRRPAGPDAARAGGRRPGRRGSEQRRDRPPPVRLRQDRLGARLQHPWKARHVVPRRDRRLGRPPGPPPSLSTPAVGGSAGGIGLRGSAASALIRAHARRGCPRPSQDLRGAGAGGRAAGCPAQPGEAGAPRGAGGRWD